MSKIEEIGINEDPKSPQPSNQSLPRTEKVSQLQTKLTNLINIRNRSYPIIRDRELIDYWDDSMKRFTQFKQRPSHKEVWQANTASTTPADKLIGILSKLAAQGMEAQVMSTTEVSFLASEKERILTSLLKVAGAKNDDDKQLVLEMFTALSKGTVIGFEGWFHGDKEIRTVTDQDSETGEVKFKKEKVKEWNDVISTIVPTENFFPGNIWVRPAEIQDMDECAVREVISKDQFDLKYGKFPDASKVTVRNDIVGQEKDEKELFYMIPDGIADDEVEIWQYFNKATDEYMILANNIWINPIGDAEVAPLWWNHKKLPFWAGVFEPFAENFFYGRSLPDKLASLVDINDALFDRILDQLAVSIHKPIVTTKSATSITKGYMSPNNVIQVKGANLASDFKTLDVSEPSQAHIQMLGVIQQRMESASIASEAIGRESAKEKTATEILQTKESALELVSLFLKFMEFGARDKNRLRLANIYSFILYQNIRRIRMLSLRSLSYLIVHLNVELIDKRLYLQLRT